VNAVTTDGEGVSIRETRSNSSQVVSNALVHDRYVHLHSSTSVSFCLKQPTGGLFYNTLRKDCYDSNNLQFYGKGGEKTSGGPL
jgi:hypothetical protein